jgi:hypothetical protein
VSFAALGRKSVLQAVKEVFAEQPERPKPIVSPPAPTPVAVAKPAPAAPASAIEQATAGLIEAGMRFFESLASRGAGQRAPAGDGAAQAIARAISGVVRTDPRTNRPMLAIPLPESVTTERLTSAVAQLVGSLVKQG